MDISDLEEPPAVDPVEHMINIPRGLGDDQSGLIEETYTDSNEKLLKFWLKISKENSAAHYKKGKHFKSLHEYFALPATIVPIIYSPISGLLADRDGIQYANVAILALTGILSGTHAFFDFGRKSQKHFQFEAQYADVTSTILVELTKERRLRIKADRFIEMIQAKIDSLGASAPVL